MVNIVVCWWAGSGNMIVGNNMSKYAQCKRTYQPAVGWYVQQPRDTYYCELHNN